MRRTPSINGSTVHALVEEQCDVMDAARALRNIMRKRRPHMRDYQVATREVWKADRDEWAVLMAQVEEVMTYAETTALKLRGLS
jgi:hypothetical protein